METQNIEFLWVLTVKVFVISHLQAEVREVYKALLDDEDSSFNGFDIK